MASGEGGPNPAGWNTLTPEQLRLAATFRMDDMSPFANFTWIKSQKNGARTFMAEQCMMIPGWFNTENSLYDEVP